MRSSVNEALAANGQHEAWTPLLELAAREVFELMLGVNWSRRQRRRRHPWT